jgi:hypothetical protein
MNDRWAKHILDEAIARFDCEKAAKVYALLGWEWSPIKRVPNAADILDSLNKLRDTLLTVGSISGPLAGRTVRSGGLAIGIDEGSDEEGYDAWVAFTAVDSTRFAGVLDFSEPWAQEQAA